MYQELALVMSVALTTSLDMGDPLIPACRRLVASMVVFPVFFALFQCSP